jgi:alpha-L-rhamnosidase
MSRLRILIIVACFFIIKQKAIAQTATNLKAENQVKPIGLSAENPLLSWDLKLPTKSAKQTGYQIIVASTEAILKKNIGDIWDSKKVVSDQTASIQYAGKALESTKRYFWKVKLWNEKAKVMAWSAMSYFEMGSLKKTNWEANWIGKIDTEKKGIKALDFQKEFKLSKRATKMKLFVAGLGAYSIIINGKKIGDSYLASAMSKLSDTLYYQTFTIDPELISPGTNFISATVGNGFWGSGTPLKEGSFLSDGPNRLLFQLDLSFYDGSVQTVASDASWQVRNSATISNSVYGGETYDGQLEYSKDWKNADILNELVNKVTIYEAGVAKGKEKTINFTTKNKLLIPNKSTELKVAEELKAVTVNSPKKNQYVFDFGKVITGFVQLSVEGKADKEVEITFSESLDKKGFVDQSALKIKPKDVYILKGYSTEIWEPKFTIHKFRYVQLSGYSGKADINSLLAKSLGQEVK